MFQMFMGLSAGVGIGLVALALTTGLGYAALRLVVDVMAWRLKLPQ
jgi:hypothetical protein